MKMIMKAALCGAYANAITFNSAPPQVMAQFEEDAPKAVANYTNMTIAEVTELYEAAETDFNSAFKAASDTLNKTNKYTEA